MIKKYKNPIARKGDYADPFVLRYNGRYYLYATNPDIRCFSSNNLIDWVLEGPTITEDTFQGLVPFAPEVVYSNGKFYLYTSPSGYGHYILESDAPTGPFRKVSDNIGHSIDGSVFIDDDGKWYFYWAGDEGIWGCEMKSPTEFGEPVLTGAYMEGWTEGPFICKQNGIYYMTYTGNHYLSDGYRINAAWSKHPLRDYVDEKNNPIIIHTNGDGIGLGHSSTVLGPDLVSHYIVYHNMNGDRTRDLNIDRQLWYGKVTQIIGPTRIEQIAPAMPTYSYPAEDNETLTWKFVTGSWNHENDLYVSVNNSFLVLSEQIFSDDFTVEFNIKLKQNCQNGSFGIVVGKLEDSIYKIQFNKNNHTLQLWNNKKDQEMLLAYSRLPENYDFHSLHCVRIEYSKSGLIIFVDNRKQLIHEEIYFEKVRIGYFSEAGSVACGYTAITEAVSGTEEMQNQIVKDCLHYPVFGEGIHQKTFHGDVLLREGDNSKYQLWVDKDAEYKIYIISDASEKSGRASIILDGLRMDNSIEKKDICINVLYLHEGIHSLEIIGEYGELAVKNIYFTEISEEQQNENLALPITVEHYGKKLIGDPLSGDFKIIANLKAYVNDECGKAGLLIKVTEPSEGGEGEDSVLGVHFFFGYSIAFTGKEIEVARHQYDENILATCPYELDMESSCKVSIEMKDTWIRVFINHEENPRIEVKDLRPLLHGRMGIWAKNGSVTLDKLNVILSAEYNNK
ncbi:glycoside hydrolase family 43 protein [Alloiococcus sp. CFN-8]|uniref:glycoside hydrolase family 43 protein n=1 Tax=Alloiococcus sp. CFN-8 TaxID=3416081 RepID=UPI003CEA35EA